MTQSYFERLTALMAKRGQLCVGVDPHEGIVRQWGYDYDLAGIERLCREMIEVIGDRVAVYKPQAAFFECFGSAGVAVLARVLADIKAVGALSILDVKRGDIGSTMQAYARAYLSEDSDLHADAITISPYLGFDSLAPAIELAHVSGRGLYVLCRTSNPHAESIQLAADENGVTIAQSIVDKAIDANSKLGDASVGLVIGATLGELKLDLSGFQGSILAPGIGAQGATMEDLPKLFGRGAKQVLANVSRGVMAAGPAHESLLDRVESYQSCNYLL